MTSWRRSGGGRVGVGRVADRQVPVRYNTCLASIKDT